VAGVDDEWDFAELDRATQADRWVHLPPPSRVGAAVAVGDATDGGVAVDAFANGFFSLGIVLEVAARWAPIALIVLGLTLVIVGVAAPAGPLVIAGLIVVLIGAFNWRVRGAGTYVSTEGVRVVQLLRTDEIRWTDARFGTEHGSGGWSQLVVERARGRRVPAALRGVPDDVDVDALAARLNEIAARRSSRQ
jgi:hypothetical protein